MTSAIERIRRTTFDALPMTATGPRVRCIDMHTGGEPVRVILEGGPDLAGASILACRREMIERHDDLRTLLMWEPRGHADMYGLLPLPPERADSDFGVLFLHNEGYSTMCGHATLAIAKLAVLLGWVDHDGHHADLRIDAPCGPLAARVDLEAGRICGVGFTNVPSFVVELDASAVIAGGHRVRYDLAYGGAFYAYVDAEAVGLDLSPASYGEIVRRGREIKAAVQASRTIEHPFEADLGFLYGTIFVGPATDERFHSRNVCVFADGEVDRSSTGSGISGRAAIHHARGELAVGEAITIESLVGSEMSVEIAGTGTYGPHDAVIPRVSGDAWICGRSEFVLDPADPFPRGFFLR